jgi:hypothetical protein
MRSTMVLIVALGIMMLTSCSSKGQGSGILAGHIDIGPLQPVARAGEPEPTPSPEVYGAWQIVVFNETGKREITQAIINSSGDYQVQLSMGTYKVTAEPISGGGLGHQQIFTIEIIRNKTTQLDIAIDTGIR